MDINRNVQIQHDTCGGQLLSFFLLSDIFAGLQYSY